jgi:RNA polymerase sigma-70 factor (ECF subfamily)
MSPLPEPSPGAILPPAVDFDTLIAVLPPSQREVVSMLKVSGMSLEEVARATASSVGSVKLKAHRAYEKLRAVLRSGDHVV